MEFSTTRTGTLCFSTPPGSDIDLFLTPTGGPADKTYGLLTNQNTTQSFHSSCSRDGGELTDGSLLYGYSVLAKEH